MNQPTPKEIHNLRESLTMTDEQIKDLVQTMNDGITYDHFQDLYADTLKEIERQANSSPEERAAWGSFTRWDKILFTAKEMFCKGYHLGLLYAREGINYAFDEMEERESK